MCVFVYMSFSPGGAGHLFAFVFEAMLPSCYKDFAGMRISCSPSRGSHAHLPVSGPEYKGCYKDSCKAPIRLHLRIRMVRFQASVVSG